MSAFEMLIIIEYFYYQIIEETCHAVQICDRECDPPRRLTPQRMSTTSQYRPRVARHRTRYLPRSGVAGSSGRAHGAPEKNVINGWKTLTRCRFTIESATRRAG